MSVLHRPKRASRAASPSTPPTSTGPPRQKKRSGGSRSPTSRRSAPAKRRPTAKKTSSSVPGALNGLAADASHLYWSVNGEAPTNPGNDLYRYSATAGLRRPPPHRSHRRRYGQWSRSDRRPRHHPRRLLHLLPRQRRPRRSRGWLSGRLPRLAAHRHQRPLRALPQPRRGGQLRGGAAARGRLRRQRRDERRPQRRRPLRQLHRGGKEQLPRRRRRPGLPLGRRPAPLRQRRRAAVLPLRPRPGPRLPELRAERRALGESQRGSESRHARAGAVPACLHAVPRPLGRRQPLLLSERHRPGRRRHQWTGRLPVSRLCPRLPGRL